MTTMADSTPISDRSKMSLTPRTPKHRGESTNLKYPSQDNPEDELALGYGSEGNGGPISSHPPKTQAGSIQDANRQNGDVEVEQNQDIDPESQVSEKKSMTESKSPNRETDTQRGAVDFETEPADEPPSKKPKIVVKSAAPGRSKYDNPDEMLTNSRAPLGTVNLRDLLCSEAAWELLDAAEKKKVLAMFPDQEEVLDPDTDRARPDIASLRNNNHFRHDIARYQENIRQGRHDPDWIRQAQAAHRQRQLGFYEEFIAQKFEDSWGVKLPSCEDQVHGPGGENVSKGIKSGSDAAGHIDGRVITESNEVNSLTTPVVGKNGQCYDGSTPGLTEDRASEEDNSLPGGTPKIPEENPGDIPGQNPIPLATAPDENQRYKEGAQTGAEIAKSEASPKQQRTAQSGDAG